MHFQHALHFLVLSRTYAVPECLRLRNLDFISSIILNKNAHRKASGR
jgi:hypothetical protein